MSYNYYNGSNTRMLLQGRGSMLASVGQPVVQLTFNGFFPLSATTFIYLYDRDPGFPANGGTWYFTINGGPGITTSIGNIISSATEGDRLQIYFKPVSTTEWLDMGYITVPNCVSQAGQIQINANPNNIGVLGGKAGYIICK